MPFPNGFTDQRRFRDRRKNRRHHPEPYSWQCSNSYTHAAAIIQAAITRAAIIRAVLYLVHTRCSHHPGSHYPGSHHPCSIISPEGTQLCRLAASFPSCIPPQPKYRQMLSVYSCLPMTNVHKCLPHATSELPSFQDVITEMLYQLLKDDD